MALRLRTVVIDANDVDSLVSFWHGVLPDRKLYPPEHDRDPYTGLKDEAKGDATILIQRVPEPPQRAKNRVHLDLHTPEPGPEAERIAALGGKVERDFVEDGSRCIVMTDPEGNEFCVVEHPNP